MDMITQVVLDVIGNVISGRIDDLIHHIESGDSAMSLITGDDELSSRVLEALSVSGAMPSDLADADWGEIADALRAMTP